MQVQVRLFGTLRRHAPGKKPGEPLAVDLPEGASVGRLLEALDLSKEIVKVVFVNGVIREEDCVLREGDEVGIFPPVAGGHRPLPEGAVTNGP